VGSSCPPQYRWRQQQQWGQQAVRLSMEENDLKLEYNNVSACSLVHMTLANNSYRIDHFNKLMNKS
jgi:hypothetical protein